MPFQNRVNPFGQIIATPARGTVMGNRGCLHDTTDHPLRQYQTKRWIICKLQFKDRRRKPMPPGEYTSLFFLDEATALAAGHRPCRECNHEKFYDFVRQWAAANPEHAGSSSPKVGTLDAQLHRERMTDAYYQRDNRKRAYLETIDGLPDCSFIALGTELTPYLVRGPHVFPWSAAGYGAPVLRPTGIIVTVLTPHSTVRALAHGYKPHVHPTADSVTGEHDLAAHGEKRV